MKEVSQGSNMADTTQYGHLLFNHKVKGDYFGKYINFEGYQQFKSPMSALYLIVRDTKPNGDAPHVHDFDEYLSFVGLDPDSPDYLGGDIELCMGKEQEPHFFNKSTTIYIPKGLWHLPLTFQKIYKPFMLVHLFLTPQYTRHE